MGLFLRKNHLLRSWGWLSLLNWIGALTLSLFLKLPPRKLGSWFALWSFYLLRLLFIYKSTIRPCMVGAPSCYLGVLDKLQKRICRAVGPLLATSLEPLAHPRNVATLYLFCMYYFRRYSSELTQLLNCMNFLSPLLDVTRMSMSTVSFLGQLGSGILCL